MYPDTLSRNLSSNRVSRGFVTIQINYFPVPLWQLPSIARFARVKLYTLFPFQFGPGPDFNRHQSSPLHSGFHPLQGVAHRPGSQIWFSTGARVPLRLVRREFFRPSRVQRIHTVFYDTTGYQERDQIRLRRKRRIPRLFC